MHTIARSRVTPLVRAGKADIVATLVILIADEFWDVLPAFLSVGSKSVV